MRSRGETVETWDGASTGSAGHSGRPPPPPPPRSSSGHGSRSRESGSHPSPESKTPSGSRDSLVSAHGSIDARSLHSDDLVLAALASKGQRAGLQADSSQAPNTAKAGERNAADPWSFLPQKNGADIDEGRGYRR